MPYDNSVMLWDKSSPPERLLDTVQPEPPEGVGMDLEELHTFFEQYGSHQRTSDLARGAAFFEIYPVFD
jgi:hypothetical protein